MNAALVKRIGLFGGPLLGLRCYYLLPPHYCALSPPRDRRVGEDAQIHFAEARRVDLFHAA